MRRSSKVRTVFALAGLSAAATMLPTTSFAQFPGGGGGPGMARRLPFLMGTVDYVDAAAGTITVSPRFGGDAQTLKVREGARIMTEAAATAADLKVGDQVQVTGVPTAISASQITIGQPPRFFSMPPRFGGGAGGGPGAGGAA